jgi:hypothetical protein
LTEVGRANIIKAQLLPIISFVGSTLNLPPSYEKQISTVINQFLWAGGTEKEQRALCIKTRGKGGLSIPHIQSRLSASKAYGFNACKKKTKVSSASLSKMPI